MEPESEDQARRPDAAQLASIFERLAQTLQHSAALAMQHAGRAERAGQHDVADHERRVADQALQAAWRARARAREQP